MEEDQSQRPTQTSDHDDGRLASAQREVLKQCAEFEKMLKEQEFKDRKMASPYQTPVDFT